MHSFSWSKRKKQWSHQANTHKSHRFSNRWNFKYKIHTQTHPTKIIFKNQFENNNVNKDNGRAKKCKIEKNRSSRSKLALIYCELIFRRRQQWQKQGEPCIVRFFVYLYLGIVLIYSVSIKTQQWHNLLALNGMELKW